jgi:hypothetical protein
VFEQVHRKLPNVLAVEPNDYAELEAAHPQPPAATAPEAGQAFDAMPMEQNLLMPASAGLVPNDPRFSAQWNLVPLHANPGESYRDKAGEVFQAKAWSGAS